MIKNVHSHRGYIPRVLCVFTSNTIPEWDLLNIKRGFTTPYYFLGTPLTTLRMIRDCMKNINNKYPVIT